MCAWVVPISTSVPVSYPEPTSILVPSESSSVSGTASGPPLATKSTSSDTHVSVSTPTPDTDLGDIVVGISKPPLYATAQAKTAFHDPKIKGQA